MSKPKEISVSKFRSDLPDILYKVLLQGESYVVVKHGRKFARVCPVSDPKEVDRLSRGLGKGRSPAKGRGEVVAVRKLL